MEAERAEWHGGTAVLRGYPDAIKVQACPDCGVRVGAPWEDCPKTGFRHAEGEVVVYVPRDGR